MLIVTLTSIPPRFAKLGPTLESLTQQTARPDRIILYVPRTYRRFPDYDGHLPEVPEGVEICQIDEDYGPATKVLPAVRAFRGQDCDILFCDDDRIYPPDWTALFLRERKAHPEACIAPVARPASELFDSKQIRDHHPRAVQRAWATDIPFLLRFAVYLVRQKLFGMTPRPTRLVIKTAGYTDLLMGFGGVLVRPEFFDDTAFDIPDVMWTVDDIWLSGMLAKNNVPIWTPANVAQPKNSHAWSEASLAASVIEGAGRDAADRTCFEYLQKTYGIWP